MIASPKEAHSDLQLSLLSHSVGTITSSRYYCPPYRSEKLAGASAFAGSADVISAVSCVSTTQRGKHSGAEVVACRSGAAGPDTANGLAELQDGIKLCGIFSQC